ncbi:MAG: hypothetical protein RBR08_15575 [Desulforegulaceae bacterium]|nr:hypothetical protein [Desulforegulaceae bacterium]
MNSKQKLAGIIKKIEAEFKNTKIELVKNEDIINYFHNKENANLVQKKFLFGSSEKENVS